MNKSIKISLNYLLGSVIFILLSFSLYKQLVHQKDFYSSWERIKSSWHSAFFWLVFFLMFINWGLETIKWEKMMRPLETISFNNAFKAVLAGCSITMITPNRIGEYGGRILFVAKENRIKAISISILSGISQLIITFLIGCMGLFFLKYQTDADSGIIKILGNNLIIGVSVVSCIALLLLFLNVDLFIKLFSKWTFFNKITKNVAIVTIYTKKELLRILILSLLRYLVFILQYLIILRVMNVLIEPTICISLISIFYLMMALAPTIGIIELPVRATAASMILGVYNTNMLGIQAAVFAIWLINLFIPSLLGSMFFLKTTQKIK